MAVASRHHLLGYLLHLSECCNTIFPLMATQGLYIFTKQVYRQKQTFLLMHSFFACWHFYHVSFYECSSWCSAPLFVLLGQSNAPLLPATGDLEQQLLIGLYKRKTSYLLLSDAHSVDLVVLGTILSLGLSSHNAPCAAWNRRESTFLLSMPDKRIFSLVPSILDKILLLR